ncbi:hypothetical protein PIROE2DRAFT_2959 [Piromyces sp. E2]|nr:hypothetical protein PIROE2DRAFT_2959 [Piromyces sp. E2]|eukprot:OUM69250.1 hypothetical protein PIROE2DRAFT_2959 [Piromyces sp. E2]
MLKIYKYIYYIYIILFTLRKINLINAIEINIKNDNINNLEDIIYHNQNEDNLILHFNENYYDMSNISFKGFNITVISNITFLGYKENIIFDFKNKSNGLINISYSENSGNTVLFENIIFKNYFDPSTRHMFTINIDSDTNYLKFKNCTFTDNQYFIFGFNVYSFQPSNQDYFVSFDECKFL